MYLEPNTRKEEPREVRNVKQKKLDREHIGKIRKKKGQTLFGMCSKTFEVYEVQKKVVKSKVAKVDFASGKVIGEEKKEEYLFVKGDSVLFALNIKNACRKFQKMVDGWYD